MAGNVIEYDDNPKKSLRSLQEGNYKSINVKNSVKTLRDRSRYWANGYSPSHFQALSKEQAPEVLFIACSDSRVTPSVISQSNLGEIFEFRNIANITLNTDTNIKALLCYALLHLNIKHVVVCGHYYCGGVKAAMSIAEEGAELGEALETHLAPIVETYKANQTELAKIEDEHLRHQKLVELNVAQQVKNLRSLDFVQDMKSECEVTLPMFHGAVFDIGSGKLNLVSNPSDDEVTSHVKDSIANEIARLSVFASSNNPFKFISAAEKQVAIQTALKSIESDEQLLKAIKDTSSDLHQALNQKRLLPVTFLSFSKGFTLDANSLHRVQEIIPDEISHECEQMRP